MIIRKAHRDDTAAMGGLLAELFAIEDDFVIDADKQILGLQLLLQNSDSTLLVAETSGCVVGMVSMQRFISTAMGGEVGLIEDMIVTADWRGQGVGRLLLSTMIERSQQLGYGRLSLAADRRNEQALAFYRTFGFETGNMGLMYKIG